MKKHTDTLHQQIGHSTSGFETLLKPLDLQELELSQEFRAESNAALSLIQPSLLVAVDVAEWVVYWE
jgi:hypothetical protein